MHLLAGSVSGDGPAVSTTAKGTRPSSLINVLRLLLSEKGGWVGGGGVDP